MKHSGKFFLAFLSLSLLSYGISGAAYASVEPLSVTTNKEFYVEGATITISGFVKDFDTSDPMRSVDVTIMILAPNGNLVSVAQVTPSSDGNYSTTVIAAGMISTEGDYTVKAKWSAQENQTVFKFGGSGTAISTPEPTEQTQVMEVVDEEPDIEPEPVMTEPTCGPGTVLKNGLCVAEQQQKGGGCLIATAAFGSEMAPQVQFLREIRDNTVLQTQSGSAFMTGFNQFYYSFSPTIADYERENPAFKETVKIAITPLLTSLAILNYVDIDSEEEMLGYGIGVILLNIGMYFVAPAVVIFKIKNRK
uniref:Macroglobulin domain-containing protein n=1 Tax=uncultured marine crenarchaeote HF4000_ANIW93I24 TaxID=455565 RepID=B3T2X2_9ARCH|nr:hypothetical protein ALOHA_HF4000ANIW93I24ctg1g5 [uncultured marine crenarchaeote HF4000_ANIW93I24]